MRLFSDSCYGSKLFTYGDAPLAILQKRLHLNVLNGANVGAGRAREVYLGTLAQVMTVGRYMFCRKSPCYEETMNFVCGSTTIWFYMRIQWQHLLRVNPYTELSRSRVLLDKTEWWEDGVPAPNMGRDTGTASPFEDYRLAFRGVDIYAPLVESQSDGGGCSLEFEMKLWNISLFVSNEPSFRKEAHKNTF